MLTEGAAVAQRYDWQRFNKPFDKPKLAFDTHFQGDGLPVPPHNNLLVAVSGGSDSIALLHLLDDWQKRAASPIKLHVATVDHGLRVESRSEADAVAKLCKSLDLPHQILNWEKSGDSKKSSQDARIARYDLLVDHALTVGATCLLLGHTKNDQAETVLMRALRSVPDSSLRGLSGMSQWSHHATPQGPVSIYRPLLHINRKELQDYLQTRKIEWIDDPTNNDVNSERVRLRNFLHNQSQLNIDQISRFAAASGAHRAWMSDQAAHFIRTYASQDDENNYWIAPNASSKPWPLAVVAESLAALVFAIGGKPYRVPISKTTPIAQAWLDRTPTRSNVGRALLSNSKRGIKIEREKRKQKLLPASSRASTIEGGRTLISKDSGNRTGKPFIPGFETFLPSTDLPVRRAILSLFNT